MVEKVRSPRSSFVGEIVVGASAIFHQHGDGNRRASGFEMSDLLWLAVIQDTKVFSLQAGQNTPTWSVTSTSRFTRAVSTEIVDSGLFCPTLIASSCTPPSVSAWGADRASRGQRERAGLHHQHCEDNNQCHSAFCD